MIPIILKIKRTIHKEIAKAQDLVIAALYEVFDDAVLHGGTAIWRCYQGNRFSEDIDAYLLKDKDKINRFFEHLQKKGFVIEKKKVGENSIYSNLKFNHTEVRFEALFKKANGSLRDYETAEGNYITVYTLTAEELIDEKVSTYLKRLKIRDLYDIFFLLKYVQNKEKIVPRLKELIDKFKPPIDEKDLQVIILEGLVPDYKKMLLYIKDRC
ncbi:MAG: nucleotidyl transferase AbiEii/AbiGii toxin family protein [Nanoarchaeota archaeon]